MSLSISSFLSNQQGLILALGPISVRFAGSRGLKELEGFSFMEINVDKHRSVFVQLTVTAHIKGRVLKKAAPCGRQHKLTESIDIPIVR